MRRAANRDKGEAAIIAALRKAGCSVLPLSMADVPDLLVGVRGACFLLEVKAPLGPRGGTSADGQQLRAGQVAWHRAWRGHVDVVRTPIEALVAVGLV